MKYVKMDARGVSLVEVLASIVIITIVLISFMQIFTQSNKVTASNNDKLIAVNLAEAELERLKVDPFSAGMTRNTSLSPLPTYNSGEIVKTLFDDGDEIRQYTVSYTASQSTTDFNNKLINVVLTVQFRHSKSTVEGYLSYD